VLAKAGALLLQPCAQKVTKPGSKSGCNVSRREGVPQESG
jgi:hypothetical protein